MTRENTLENGHRKTFQVVDYVIFALTLSISAVIGIYYAIKDRKRQDTRELLLGGGNMPILPVAVSLLGTACSAISLLGIPAEIYNYNTMFMWCGIGIIPAIFCASHIFIPIFYELRLTSCYEYLELRFNKFMRTFCTILYILVVVFYTGIVLYAPSLAINAVTGLSLWGSVFVVAIVSMLYTCLGGMKAVLWADTFQVVIILSGIMAVLIQGSIEVGGFANAWRIADQNQRIVFNEVSFSPTTRHSVWSLVIGGASAWLVIYGAFQYQVQRCLTCPTLRKAQLAMWLNAPGIVFIFLICGLIGVVINAFYSTCDPISSGLLTASDQLVPLFVMDILGYIPGIPGLFIACIFSGTLSTISSTLNSLSAVILEDLLKPFCLKGIREDRATKVSRLIALVGGIICIFFAWIASQIDGVLIATISIIGLIGSAILGTFFLGIIFPWANSKGAIVGSITCILLMSWIGIGSFLAKLHPLKSPVSVSGCNWTLTYIDNATLLNTSLPNFIDNTTLPLDTELPFFADLYMLSYQWYGTTGVMIVIIVGLVVSFLTGPQKPCDLDPMLICPIFDIVLPCLPTRIRHYLYFGVKHEERKMKKPKIIVSNVDDNEFNLTSLLEGNITDSDVDGK